MSPPSPTSNQTYRRHLARTSRGRNFTQRVAPPPVDLTPTVTPVRQQALPQTRQAQGELPDHPPRRQLTNLQLTFDHDEEDESEEEFEHTIEELGLNEEDGDEEGEEDDEEDITEELEEEGDGDGEGAIEEASLNRNFKMTSTSNSPLSHSSFYSGTDSTVELDVWSDDDDDAFNLRIPESNVDDSTRPRLQPNVVTPSRARRGNQPAHGQENYGAIANHLYGILTEHSAIVPMGLEAPFDQTGLKEIGNLASWTVSTCKPGCGVEALRDEDTALFWQSDGPQPHHLNIHFSRLVSILSIRIFLDFDADESYTPTKISFFAGTGYHDLISFKTLEFTQPKGWIDVSLEGVGGGDGNTLRAFLVQVKVIENHQNGKDTHVRGLKIYARDEKSAGGLGGIEELVGEKIGAEERKLVANRTGMLMEPDWMGEIELR